MSITIFVPRWRSIRVPPTGGSTLPCTSPVFPLEILHASRPFPKTERTRTFFCPGGYGNAVPSGLGSDGSPCFPADCHQVYDLYISLSFAFAILTAKLLAGYDMAVGRKALMTGAVYTLLVLTVVPVLTYMRSGKGPGTALASMDTGNKIIVYENKYRTSTVFTAENNLPSGISR